ncbi:MAG: lysostaphin resistance A-like protein [Thermoanaerobaculia bacterium]
MTPDPETPWFTLSPDTALTARLAAVAEPGFVLIAGTLLAKIALAEIAAGNAEHYLYNLPAPDFRSAALIQLLQLTVRFSFVLALAVGLGVWRGRSTAASYGVTLQKRSLPELVRVGILVGLIASLPEQVLRLMSEYVRLGPGTRFWALEARVPWDAAFWLYMAVGSYAFVPILEELFTRGYVLGRLRESFSAGGSLLATATFFTIAHGQYRHADALAIGAQASLFVWAGICAYAVYRTGSLLPAIIAHAMINVPMNLDARWGMLALSFLALPLWRRAISSWIRGIIDTFGRVHDWLATSLALVAIVVILVSVGLNARMPYIWMVVLGSASLLGLRRRSPWADVRMRSDAPGGAS